MLIAFNGTHETGQHLGDTICAIKVAYLFAQNEPAEHYILTLSPSHDLNFLWEKFIATYEVQVIYDNFEPGNLDQRYQAWGQWRETRQIDNQPIDNYKELYLRIHGGQRQGLLCGQEAGIGKRNIFEYFYFGQERCQEFCHNSDHFGDELISYPILDRKKAVLIAPYAKCQGNKTFTFDFWSNVVHSLVADGIEVTVNWDQPFCQDLQGSPYYRQIYPGPGKVEELLAEVCSHKLVSCGNTGIGWLAGLSGTPLLAMQPSDSHFADYRYEWCGVKSLVEFLDQPNADYCAHRIKEELAKPKTASIHFPPHEVMKIVREGAYFSVNPFPKLKFLADELLSVVDLAGAVAELGSYRGGASFILRRLAPLKKLHLFDTWSGNPFFDPLCHHKIGEWAANLDDCKRLIGHAEYHQGVFPDTAAGLEDEEFCFCYVDCDTYQAAKAAIEFFWPRLVPGGLLVFDDYGWEPCAGIKKAVDDFFPKTNLLINQGLFACVATK